MATPTAEQLRIIDGDVNGAAKTAALQTLREIGRIVLLGVPRQFFHDV